MKVVFSMKFEIIHESFLPLIFLFLAWQWMKSDHYWSVIRRWEISDTICESQICTWLCETVKGEEILMGSIQVFSWAGLSYECFGVKECKKIKILNKKLHFVSKNLQILWKKMQNLKKFANFSTHRLGRPHFYTWNCKFFNTALSDRPHFYTKNANFFTLHCQTHSIFIQKMQIFYTISCR